MVYQVSTKEQNEVRQLVALSITELKNATLYGQNNEKGASGLQKRMMRRMRKGDLLVVKKYRIVWAEIIRRLWNSGAS